MTDKNLPAILTFEDRFPLTEKRLKESFSENQIRDLSQSAVEVLNSILSLEQLSSDHMDPELKGNAAEIHRIEQKIDFITELLARVLQVQQNIPQTKAIKMSAESVFWAPEISLNPGDNCIMTIYLSQKYPMPLELPVEVINYNTEGLEELNTEARVLLFDETVIEELTRLVFLYHRRQIARNRTRS